MREIPLSNSAELILVDDADFELVSRYSWRFHSNGFTIIGDVDGETLTLGQFLLDPPTGMQVDHIDRNLLNNQRANLRLATPSQNAANRRSWGQVGFKGVWWDKRSRRYRAEIMKDGKRTHLGCFTDPEDAARAYDAAARALYGEYAYLNFDR